MFHFLATSTGKCSSFFSSCVSVKRFIGGAGGYGSNASSSTSLGKGSPTTARLPSKYLSASDYVTELCM